MSLNGYGSLENPGTAESFTATFGYFANGAMMSRRGPTRLYSGPRVACPKWSMTSRSRG